MGGTRQYQHFIKLTDELYTHCTLEEKLAVYLQHHPNRAVPLLKELIEQLYPKEEPSDE